MFSQFLKKAMLFTGNIWFSFQANIISSGTDAVLPYCMY